MTAQGKRKGLSNSPLSYLQNHTPEPAKTPTMGHQGGRTFVWTVWAERNCCVLCHLCILLGTGTAHVANKAAPYQPQMGVWRCFKIDKFLTKTLISPNTVDSRKTHSMNYQAHLLRSRHLGTLLIESCYDAVTVAGAHFSRRVGGAHLIRAVQSHFTASLMWIDTDS